MQLSYLLSQATDLPKPIMSSLTGNSVPELKESGLCCKVAHILPRNKKTTTLTDYRVFAPDSIRVVVTIEQTEPELDKAASLIREAAESVLN